MKFNLKVIALFLIIAMADMTPASAMSVGEINNNLENNLNSYNKLSWWDKIWHIGDVIASLAQVASDLSVEIRNLNDQAINSQNEASNLKNKLEYLNSQINNRKAENMADAEYKNSGIADTKKAIKSNANINSQEINAGNITNHSTNQTTNHNNSSSDENNSSLANKTSTLLNNSSVNNGHNSLANNSSRNETELITNKNNSKLNESISNNNNTTIKSKKTSKLSVSDYAKEDGEKYPEAYFKSKDIKYSKLILSVSQLKKGQIVQLLYDGVFKYWVFNGLTTDENGVTYINLITGNGKSYKDDIESFNDDFTGLTYEIDNESSEEENPYHSVKKVQDLQIKSLDSLNNKINQQNTWASISNYILIGGGALTALGVILGTACALCSIIFAIASAATATIVLGIPCATIATIAAWAAIITGAAAVIVLAIGLPLTVGGGIALGVLNSINDGDKSEYNRLKDDYNSDEL